MTTLNNTLFSLDSLQDASSSHAQCCLAFETMVANGIDALLLVDVLRVLCEQAESIESSFRFIDSPQMLRNKSVSTDEEKQPETQLHGKH